MINLFVGPRRPSCTQSRAGIAQTLELNEPQTEPQRDGQPQTVSRIARNRHFANCTNRELNRAQAAAAAGLVAVA
eukprot:11270954-Alexandrium_andersonii.AAC.1